MCVCALADSSHCGEFPLCFSSFAFDLSCIPMGSHDVFVQASGSAGPQQKLHRTRSLQSGSDIEKHFNIWDITVLDWWIELRQILSDQGSSQGCTA